MERGCHRQVRDLSIATGLRRRLLLSCLTTIISVVTLGLWGTVTIQGGCSYFTVFLSEQMLNIMACGMKDPFVYLLLIL